MLAAHADSSAQSSCRDYSSSCAHNLQTCLAHMPQPTSARWLCQGWQIFLAILRYQAGKWNLTSSGKKYVLLGLNASWPTVKRSYVSPIIPCSMRGCFTLETCAPEDDLLCRLLTMVCWQTSSRALQVPDRAAPFRPAASMQGDQITERRLKGCAHVHVVVLWGRHEGDVEVDVALQHLSALINDASRRVPDHHLHHICTERTPLSTRRDLLTKHPGASAWKPRWSEAEHAYIRL